MASDASNLKTYDRWFRARVQAALDDPRPPIPSYEVEAYFNKRRSDALREAEKRSAFRRVLPASKSD